MMEEFKVLSLVDKGLLLSSINRETIMANELAALVTGGGQGIGLAIAKRIAKVRPVLLVGRTETKLINACTSIKQDGGTAEYVVADLIADNFVLGISEKLQTLNWEIEALILNAGIGKSGASENLSLLQLRTVIETNVNSSLPLVQLVLDGMKKRKAGTICLISSVVGLKGTTHDAAYVTSKHAQIGLARSLAREYGKHGISVVPICPTYVESEMTTRSVASLANRKNISLQDAEVIIAKTSCFI